MNIYDLLNKPKSVTYTVSPNGSVSFNTSAQDIESWKDYNKDIKE